MEGVNFPDWNYVVKKVSVNLARRTEVFGGVTGSLGVIRQVMTWGHTSLTGSLPRPKGEVVYLYSKALEGSR